MNIPETTIQITLQQEDILKLLPATTAEKATHDELVKYCYDTLIELISNNKPHTYNKCPVCGNDTITKDNLMTRDDNNEPQYFHQCYCKTCHSTFDENFSFSGYINIDNELWEE